MKITLRITLLFLFIFKFQVGAVNAQESDCGWSENKKALKAYNNGLDKKKYSFKERMDFFDQALALDEDFTQALWQRTYALIKFNRSKHQPFKSTQSALLEIRSKCPQMHSAVYFFLGEICMDKEEYVDAAAYYEEFIRFSSDDDSKFERKYDQQLEIAKENKKSAAFWGYQLSHPVPYNAQKIIPLSTTENDEYLPAISPDNELLLFTRKSEIETNNRESYIQSTTIREIERFSYAKAMGQTFEKGQSYGPPFNLDESANYGGATLSANNKELYFTVCTPVQGKMNCDIFYSNYKEVLNEAGIREYTWGKPVNLGPNINTEDGWESQPTISKDGQWLMYAVFREGTRGIDIFQSHRNHDGTWGVGRNMGEPINTAGHEKSPFFHSDNMTLYFASKNGHLGMGGYDVFMSKFIDGQWTSPVNLGYPLNTLEDEHGYVISLDGKTAYFGSQQPFNSPKEKKLNIYQVSLPEEVRPEAVLMVKGRVKTTNGSVPKNATVEIRNTETQEVETIQVDTTDGTFVAIVNTSDSADFMLTAQGKDLAFNNKLIKAPKKEEMPKVQVDVAVQKSKVGQHITIENIHFATNSAEITPKSKASLDALVQYMNTHKNYQVSIEGHTDNVGDANSNLALSADRAYSVMAYLQEQGISAKRLRFKGWGEQKPISTNKSAEGRALNRRIEVVVIKH